MEVDQSPSPDDASNLILPPLTLPPTSPTTPIVRTLALRTLPNPNSLSQNQGLMTFTHPDLVRFRSGRFAMSPEEKTRGKKTWAKMGRVEACWRRFQEVGGVGGNMGRLGWKSFEEDGEGRSKSSDPRLHRWTKRGQFQVYAPTMPYIQLIRIVLAASPRKKLTLSQVSLLLSFIIN
jgi:hypothetical protein